MGKRGKLILIEGLDRTGKSTQAERIVNALGDAETSLIKFPDRTTAIGKLINDYLVNKNFNLPPESIHLLFSANRWELNDSIKQTLLSGKNVVLDRYVYSGIAYSAAKHVPGMSISWCFSPDKGLVKPDLTLFLSNDESLQLQKREGFGDERYEQVEFQNEVKDTFYKVFDQIQDENRQIVNVSNKSIDEVFDDIFIRVNAVLAKDIQDFTFF